MLKKGNLRLCSWHSYCRRCFPEWKPCGFRSQEASWIGMSIVGLIIQSMKHGKGKGARGMEGKVCEGGQNTGQNSVWKHSSLRIQLVLFVSLVELNWIDKLEGINHTFFFLYFQVSVWKLLFLRQWYGLSMYICKICEVSKSWPKNCKKNTVILQRTVKFGNLIILSFRDFNTALSGKNLKDFNDRAGTTPL